jgi:hypothetical protein
MFPIEFDVRVRHEQYVDLLRESARERLIRAVRSRSIRKQRALWPAEKHDPGRPYLWCQILGAERACLYVQ